MFGGYRSSFLLGIYMGMELLGYKVFEYLALAESAKQFSKVVVPEFPSLSLAIVEIFFQFWPLWWVCANKILKFQTKLFSPGLQASCLQPQQKPDSLGDTSCQKVEPGT